MATKKNRFLIFIFLFLIFLVVSIFIVKAETHTYTFEIQHEEDDTWSSPSINNWMNTYECFGDPERSFFRYYINLPKNAEILEAYLRIKAYRENSDDFITNLGLLDFSDCEDYSENNPFKFPIHSFIQWNLNYTWDADTWYSSPDISGLIRNFISMEGYNESNHICLRLDEGTANIYERRCVYQYDSSFEDSTELVIVYENGELPPPVSDCWVSADHYDSDSDSDGFEPQLYYDDDKTMSFTLDSEADEDFGSFIEYNLSIYYSNGTFWKSKITNKSYYGVAGCKNNNTYYVNVTAVYENGECSSLTPIITVDTENPVVEITSPASSSSHYSDFDLIEEDVDNEGNLDFCQIKIYNDEDLTLDWLNITCNEPFKIDISKYCPEKATDSCLVVKRAIDKAGNVAEENSREFSINEEDEEDDDDDGKRSGFRVICDYLDCIPDYLLENKTQKNEFQHFIFDTEKDFQKQTKEIDWEVWILLAIIFLIIVTLVILILFMIFNKRKDNKR